MDSITILVMEILANHALLCVTLAKAVTTLAQVVTQLFIWKLMELHVFVWIHL
jgi:hypothetical protein